MGCSRKQDHGVGLGHVAVPVSANERIVGAVVLEVTADMTVVHPLLHELHWVHSQHSLQTNRRRPLPAFG